VASALLDLAAAHHETSRDEEALRAVERALGLLQPLAEGDGARLRDRLFVLIGQETRGLVLRQLGKSDAAERSFEQALGQFEKLGARSSASPDVRYLRSRARFQLGRCKGADPARRSKVRSELLDPAYAELRALYLEYPHIPTYQAALASAATIRGNVALAVGDAQKAATDFENARKLLAPLLKANPLYDRHGKLGQALAGQARVARARKDAAGARALYLQAIAEHEQALKLNPESGEDRRLLDSLRAESAPLAATPPQSSRP
jgi:tetratricopeptide (TPR) repeat protein